MAYGVVAIILLVVLLFTALFRNSKPINNTYDLELARAMEYPKVNDGDDKVDEAGYVKFDAFFLKDLDNDGYANKIRGTCKEITETDTLYINLNVLTNGTLEEGKIVVQGQNINFKTAIVDDNVINGNYISDNTTQINLKNVNKGTQKLIYATIKAPNLGTDTKKYSSGENKIILTGKHKDESGTITNIYKEVKFTVDWYASVSCSIYDYTGYHTGAQSIEQVIDQEKRSVNLSFYIETKEEKGLAILKSAYLTGKIPPLNGHMPDKVEITGTDINFDYKEETGEFTAKREAVRDEDSKIVTKTVSRYNTYRFNITYPIEAYKEMNTDTISIQVPLQAYYEGYNNESNEFENPVKSNIINRTLSFLWRKIEGEVARFDVTVGKYRGYYEKDRYRYEYVVSKKKPLNIYNGISESEIEDYYTVRWDAYTGPATEIYGIKMQEPTKDAENKDEDRFLDSENQFYDMSEISKNVGIYFSGADTILGENGEIKVYDTNGDKLIHIFTSKDWNIYDSENPYMYGEPVTHIKIETSKANKKSNLTAYNIKEINDNILLQTFENKEEFKKLQNIYSYLDGDVKIEETGEYKDINTDEGIAIYEDPISVANIEVTKDTYGTQKEEKNINITIKTISSDFNIEGWTNGKFLVELPKEVLGIKINSVTPSDRNINILAYEINEIEGQKIIKIETENDKPTSYNIVINCDLTADPRIPTQTQKLKLYAINENCENYKYAEQDTHDIDGDLNEQEKVCYAEDSMYFVSPSSLLTNQEASDYNNKKEKVVAPQIATIDKTEVDTATIKISITNNYGNTISEVKIVGKIPTENNTFLINGEELGSNFNTTMLEGIQIPEELQSYVTVYYSDKEDVTEDLTDKGNNWNTELDIDKAKSYLIDLGEYSLQVEDKKEFSYKIKVPTTVKYNDISYSTHAVYFCLDTEEGKFKIETETSKLGFRIERKYNLNLKKIKEGTETPVQGAVFTVAEVVEEARNEENAKEGKVGTTNENGTFTIEDLYVDKTYILKEIRTPSAYEKNTMEYKFKVTVAIDGTKLQLEELSGRDKLKTTEIIQPTNESRGILNVEVENIPKYQIVLTKKEQGKETTISGVRYKLTGGNLVETGITISTDKNGKLTVSGLSREQEYTLTEVSAKGYYLMEEPITFKLTKEGEAVKFTTTHGNFKPEPEVTIGTDVTGIGAQDKVEVELEDEKVPTYSITLKKYAEDKDGKMLEGAQYKIEGEGIKEGGETYTTSEDGTLTIEGLYEYVESKPKITGEYTITEITPPEGYSLNKTPLKFKAERNERQELEIKIESGDEQIRLVPDESARAEEQRTKQDITVTNASEENTNIQIGLTDEPLFKLTKLEEGTQTPIPNTKFKLIKVDKDYNELGYSVDTNGEEVGELTEDISVKNLKFDSKGEWYPWTLKEDGTWQSGGHNIPSAKSNMKSNKFTLVEDGSISFEWAVSSQYEDFLYYTITDEINHTTIGGNTASTRISRYKQDDKYESLSYKTVTIQLSKGTYTIQFTYAKDSFRNYGLDAGFVRNVSVEGVRTQIPIVTTDENGIISYGLESGLYKAVEVQSADGYVFPESEDQRTYYFGIDESKTQETGEGIVWANEVASNRWNKVEAAEKTKDKGIVTVGYFTGELDLDGDNEADITGKNNDYSGFIAKYDGEGKLEFAKAITSGYEAKAVDVIQTYDNGYVVVGYFRGSNLKIDEEATNFINETKYEKAFIIKLTNNGTYSWAKEITDESLNVNAACIIEDGNKDIIVGLNTSVNPKVYKIDLSGENATSIEISEQCKIEDMAINSFGDGVVIVGSIMKGFYYSNGIIYTYKNGTVTKNMETEFAPSAIAKLRTGQYVIAGNYKGTINDVKSLSDKCDGVIAKYSDAENELTDYKFIRGTNEEIITTVKATNDGGFLIGGYTHSYRLDFNNDEQYEISSTLGNTDAIMIKYDEAGNYESYKQIQGLEMDQITDIIIEENEYIAVGYFNSSMVSANIPTSYEVNPKLSQYTDGFILNYGEVVTVPTVPEKSEIEVENELKKYIITTEIKLLENQHEAGGTITGGKVTGEIITPVETVQHGKDSKTPIEIEPKDGYKIISITINDEEYPFIPDTETGKVTIEKFEKMTSDKHIVVTFSNTASSIVVHHYVDGTESLPTPTKVAPDEVKAGEIGSYYTTQPYTESDKYELKKNEDGSLALPSNKSGQFKEAEEIVTYLYVEKKIPLTVHHYLEGTETSVERADGSMAEDITTEAIAETSYTTEPLKPYNDETEPNTNKKLAEKYELAKTPINAEGTYEYPKVEVTYEYKIKTYKIITKVKTHEEKDEYDQPKQVKGGSILGEDKAVYETVEHGQSNNLEIIAEPEENYQVKDVEVDGKKLKSIKINGQQVKEDQYTVDEATGNVKLNTITNITEDKEIEVEFERIPTKVIVYHYIYDKSTKTETTTRVKSINGEEILEETIQGRIGDMYATKAKTDQELQEGYELYKTDVNSSGYMTRDTIEVKYYYALKDADMVQSVVKDGTQVITSKDEELNYEITYIARIKNYEGNAEITIVDTLPYALDIDKMREIAKAEGKDTSGEDEKWLKDYFLNGGEYAETPVSESGISEGSDLQDEAGGGLSPQEETEAKIYTITWHETRDVNRTNVAELEEVDPIEITKNIRVVFKGISTKEPQTEEEKIFKNKVKATIKLDATGQEESKETTHDTKIQFTKNVKVTKTWEDGKNIYGRPSKVGIQIKIKGKEQQEPVATCELSEDDNWEHLFTGLRKYDDEGNEIQYVVEEVEVDGESLEYYEKH